MKEFKDAYTIVEGLSVHGNGDSPLLETYGEDYETVRKIGKKFPKKIWTVVDVGLNYLMVIAGLHLVNRMNYIVSVEEWESKEEEYIY